MKNFGSLIGLGLLLLAVAVLTTFHPILPNIVLNIFFPLMSLIASLLKIRINVFGTMKISTLIVMRVLTTLTALCFISADTFSLLVPLFFSLNILEAVLTDFKRRNWFDFFAGFLVFIASTLYIRVAWIDNTYVYMVTPHVILFIISYVIWNTNFAYFEYEASIGTYLLMVQIIPLIFIVMTMDPKYWLAIRATSVTFGSAILMLVVNKSKPFFTSPALERCVLLCKNKQSQYVISVISILLSIWFIISQNL